MRRLRRHLGAPNAGKSTLVNALVGSKVTIVSPKVQTTRMRVLGIAMRGDGPKSCWSTRRASSAQAAVGTRHGRRRLAGGRHDADLVCVMLDAKRGLDDEALVLWRYRRSGRPLFLVMNKVDTIARETWRSALRRPPTSGWHSARTFMISALSGDGVADLRAAMATAMPEGPFLYPEDQISDAPNS